MIAGLTTPKMNQEGVLIYKLNTKHVKAATAFNAEAMKGPGKFYPPPPRGID